MRTPAEDDLPGPRRRKRVRFTAPVELTVGGRRHTYDRSYDLSMNGVYVKSAKPLPLGSVGVFALILGVGMRQERIEGAFEVVRAVNIDDGLSEGEAGPGMAVKFKELTPESSERLFEVIRHNQYP